jgi:hypothetical protein
MFVLFLFLPYIYPFLGEFDDVSYEGKNGSKRGLTSLSFKFPSNLNTPDHSERYYVERNQKKGGDASKKAPEDEELEELETSSKPKKKSTFKGSKKRHFDFNDADSTASRPSNPKRSRRRNKEAEMYDGTPQEIDPEESASAQDYGTSSSPGEGDQDEEAYDWSPKIKKVLVPGRPREICIVKIVPVPVTKDGKPWKGSSGVVGEGV